MGIVNYLSRIIEASVAIAAPHYALHSSRKLIPLDIVVWRSPDRSLAAMDSLPRHHKSSDNVDSFLDIIEMSEVVMTPSAVPSKMHLQISGRSNQAGNTAKTQQSPLPASQTASQAKPKGKLVNQTKTNYNRNRMTPLNSVFASGLVPKLTIGLTRIWLI